MIHALDPFFLSGASINQSLPDARADDVREILGPGLSYLSICVFNILRRYAGVVALVTEVGDAQRTVRMRLWILDCDELWKALRQMYDSLWCASGPLPRNLSRVQAVAENLPKRYRPQLIRQVLSDCQSLL